MDHGAIDGDVLYPARGPDRSLTETPSTGLAFWMLFSVVFVALAIFDLRCLAPKSSASDAEEALSGRTAMLHIGFWFVVGLGFNLVILVFLGSGAAIVWFDGYILEFLLSMDNVFFFHVVFKSYSTPSGQVYKGLFLGILGAVVLRLLFYVVGAGVFRMAFLVQVFFGLVLVYSGYKTAVSDEDDDDPRENSCVKVITRFLPVTPTYEDGGALIVRVADEPSTPDPQVLGVSGGDLEDASVDARADGRRSGSSQVGERSRKGTMLLLVVVVLQVIDVVFAVDSVTAKIAEYDDIFINFSSSAFAMLCLRSMYFALTRLLKFFRFLKYGVALILVLIGAKLIVHPWLEISTTFSMGGITGVFILSILASVAAGPAPDEDGAAKSTAKDADSSERAGLSDLQEFHDALDTGQPVLDEDGDDFAEVMSSLRQASVLAPDGNDHDDADDFALY